MQRRGVRRSHAFQQGLEKSPVTSLSPVDRLANESVANQSFAKESFANQSFANESVAKESFANH
jgi:hypothetical protein